MKHSPTAEPLFIGPEFGRAPELPIELWAFLGILFACFFAYEILTNTLSQQ